MALQELHGLDELPPAHSVAIIINCGTRVVSTLAIASALRHARRPVLVIDCESCDGSVETFGALAERLAEDLFLLRWPLRPHGVTLDRLFGEIPVESVLLVDSDLEIRSPSIVDWMSHALDTAPDAYGAGFLNPAEELGPPRHLLPPGAGHFAERMWMPLTLLRAGPVREALGRGESFLARREYREFPRLPRLSRAAYLRFRVPVLRSLPVVRRPAFIDWDTGARIHRDLRAHGYRYLESNDWLAIRHLEGVTRAAIAGPLRRAAVRLRMVAPSREADPQREARERLHEAYGIELRD